MKAAGLADCLNISVVTTYGMGPAEHMCGQPQPQPKHFRRIITLQGHSEAAHVSNNYKLVNANLQHISLHVWSYPNSTSANGEPCFNQWVLDSLGPMACPMT